MLKHTYKRPCKVPERFRGAVLGRSLEHNTFSLCSRKQGRPAGRGTLQTSAVFGLFRGDAGEKTRKKYQAQVDAINRLEPEMQSLSDEQLADKTKDLKSRAQKNGGVDDLLVEAFAVSRYSLAFADGSYEFRDRRRSNLTPFGACPLQFSHCLKTTNHYSSKLFKPAAL